MSARRPRIDQPCKTCASDGYLTVIKRQVVQGKDGPKAKHKTLHVQVAIPAERLRARQPRRKDLGAGGDGAAAGG